MKRDIDVIMIKRLDRATITCELMTIKDDLQEFYSLIGCRTIDIVSRYFIFVYQSNPQKSKVTISFFTITKDYCDE